MVTLKAVAAAAVSPISGPVFRSEGEGGDLNFVSFAVGAITRKTTAVQGHRTLDRDFQIRQIHYDVKPMCFLRE
jgi:hypothetical protein